ncbi:hypothetical protein, partial [Klebsiella variicola]|uniref:hypothetical protein n=1 Tax=Klebsiella variicola TaxID=244366 RepID=UPI001E494FA9
IRHASACAKFPAIHLTYCLLVYFLSSGGRPSFVLRARHGNATAGDGMKRCARCNKKRSILDRIFGLDKEFCDGCLMVVNQEIREKRVVSTPARKSPGRSS